MARLVGLFRRLGQTRLFRLIVACFRSIVVCLRLPVFLLSVAAVLFDTAQWFGRWSLAPRLAGLFVAVLIAHRYTMRRFKRPMLGSHYSVGFEQVDEKRAEQLQGEIRPATLVTSEQAEVFTRAIVLTWKLHQRIVEEYRPAQRTMRRDVIIDVQIPRGIVRRALATTGEKSTTFLYPIIVPPKSVFYDNLHVYDASGERLAILSYREYLHIAATVIHQLLSSATNEPPAELPTEVIEKERAAIWGVIRRVDRRPIHDTAANSDITVTSDSSDGQENQSQRDCTDAVNQTATVTIDPVPGAQAESQIHLISATSDIAVISDSPDGQESQDDPANAISQTATATIDPAPAPCAEKRIADIEVVEDAGRELARCLLNLQTGSSNDEEERKKRRRAIRMAAELTEILYSHYAIVVAVPVPASGRFTIRYECTVIPELDLAPRIRLGHPVSSDRPRSRDKLWFRIRKMFRALYKSFNIFFSTRPIDVKISLDNAWTCQSYHVLVQCPDSMYLSKQQLLLPDEYLEHRQRGAPTLPHVRFRRRLGQPYAHFYARFLPPPRRAQTDTHGNIIKPAEKAPKLLLKFHEAPPGSVGPAALAAIAATALIWVVGYGLSHADEGILSTDVPVLLLAFPGVAASWLGFDGVTHLFEGTLTARLSLACTAFISLFATGLYVLRRQAASIPKKVAVVHAHAAAGFKIGILGITLWPWVVLTVIALFNASYLCYRWGLNSWRFRHLANRPDPAGVVAKVRQAHEGEQDDEDD